jgi:phosphoserine phosphatase RsbU/P
MGQLLSNLRENAILYGTRNTPVTVALLARADVMGFSVHHHGKPIAVHDRARIFEPGMRGPRGEGHESLNGLGLGLHICREILRAHSGTLALRSSEAEGTTFLGRLPRRQPATGPAIPER